jgi:hypothetical protein
MHTEWVSYKESTLTKVKTLAHHSGDKTAENYDKSQFEQSVAFRMKVQKTACDVSTFKTHIFIHEPAILRPAESVNCLRSD